MTHSLSPAPSTLIRGGSPQFGRYSGAIADPDVQVDGRLARMRLKEWHYVSFVGDGAFVAIAVVQLGYLSKAFAYAIDMRAGWRLGDFKQLSPLGRNVSMAASSLRGTTEFRSGDDHISITGGDAAAPRGWRVELNLEMSDRERLRGSFSIDRSEGYCLVHRLRTGRAAYTHKETGLNAVADLEWGRRAIRGAGMSASDWTRAWSDRQTRWNWAALNHRLPDGRRIGINLSAHVYDDASSESEENVAFVDDRLHVLGGARFTLPAAPSREPWRVQSMRPGEFDLTFVPRGTHSENTNALVVRSRFIQPYGEFSGTVRIDGELIDLKGAIGVVEDHLAVW